MIEKEYKEMLDVHLYNQVDELFPWDSKIKQTNYYYMDPDKELLFNNIHVRVRKKADQYRLQIKFPCTGKEDDESGLHIRNEKEKCIDDLPALIRSEEIYDITHFISKDAMKIGSLVTERKVYRPDESIEICLDRSYYEDCTDYEIEVEYTCKEDDEKLLEIKDLLTDAGITFQNKTKGKFTRFFERYLEINRGEIHVQDSVL